MNPSSMASYIYGQVYGSTTADDAIFRFYQALCQYCEANLELYYSWAAVTPPPTSTPDPMVILQCKIKTCGSLSPSGAKTPGEALGRFAADLNTQVSGWQVIWPPGFVLPPAFIIPGIVFTQSMATSPEAAWNHICQEIITGITMAATPGPLPGTHGGFTIPTPGALWTKTI